MGSAAWWRCWDEASGNSRWLPVYSAGASELGVLGWLMVWTSVQTIR